MKRWKVLKAILFEFWLLLFLVLVGCSQVEQQEIVSSPERPWLTPLYYFLPSTCIELPEDAKNRQLCGLCGAKICDYNGKKFVEQNGSCAFGQETGETLVGSECPVACSDTDGLDISTKGSTAYLLTNGSRIVKEDFGYEDGGFISEFWCLGNNPRVSSIRCGNQTKVSNGRCVHFSCADSDGGNNPYIPGTLTVTFDDGRVIILPDKCWGTSAVSEGTCQDELWKDFGHCPTNLGYFCEDGACIKE